MHLAEIIGLLGPPPLDLVKQGNPVSPFFDAAGNYIGTRPIPNESLADRVRICKMIHDEQLNEGDFRDFVDHMLTWWPGNRSSAHTLLKHPFLRSAREAYKTEKRERR
ncbi:hypothetical protein M011DRAFT_471444 [Sporormia fimetaria CBS 119925]|uniref:Protein kinase domain-containing protein n=1 Tax=Sporormia fimetaria CBS 119925 TaxID=1340428 RepID=A0A6A6UYD5_9PLEO|nr:hypothetical protein M011DRAFT_471444 [Sporormia fimetaria CBS 119925]